MKTLNDNIKKAITTCEGSYNTTISELTTSTGFKKLDEALGGLFFGELIVVSGDSCSGKTSLAINIAINAAKRGRVVAFFSLEHTGEEIGNKILGQESDIDPQLIRRGDIGKSDFSRLVDVSNRLNSLPFFVDDTNNISVQDIRGRSNAIEKLGLIVIDSLSYIKYEDNYICNELKIIAKELHVPILLTSHAAKSEYESPSREIHSCIDVSMFLEKKNEQVAELSIKKNRYGPIKSVKLFFDQRLSKFFNLAYNMENMEFLK